MLESSEYEKLKAEYAEKFAEKAAGAARQLRTYEILIAELEKDRSGVSGVSYDKVGSNPNAYVDGVHDQMLKSSSSLMRWREGKRSSEAVVRAAARAIARVQEAKYRQVLELKYLDGFGWKQVGVAVGYSTSTVMHMKVPALACLHDVMPEQYRIPGYEAL